MDIHLYNSTAYDLIEVIIIHATFLLLVLLLVLCSFVDQDSQSVFLLNQLGGSDESKRILKAVDLNRKVSPEPHVSFVSRITFWWFGDLIRLGYRRPLVTNDLWSMRPSDKIVRIVSDFGHTLNRQLVKRQAKQKQETKQTIRVNQGILFFTILSNFGPYFVLGSLFKFLFDLMQFVNPQLLSILISFTKDSEAKHWHGILIALAMLASTTVQSVIINVYFQRMFVIAIKIKSALVDLVYRKSLRLSPSARRNRTSGEIVNLLSVDSQRFMEVLPYINLIWSAPLQIVLSIYFLYQQLGTIHFCIFFT